MTDADRLLEEFILARRSGEAPDPLAWVDRAEGDDRERLAELLSDYFRYAPRRPFNRAAFAGSDADRVVKAVEPSLAGVPEAWPTLLPRLRNAARLTREQVVARLANALGVADRTPKVALYYHRMEQDTLPAEGVSDTVLSALAAIVGTTADALRAAGTGFGGQARSDAASGGGFALPRPASSPVFARSAQPDAPGAPPSATDPDNAAADDAFDEVDRLFLDG